MHCSICKTTYWTGGHLAPADCVPVLRDALAAERAKREEAERHLLETDQTWFGKLQAADAELAAERAYSAAYEKRITELCNDSAHSLALASLASSGGYGEPDDLRATRIKLDAERAKREEAERRCADWERAWSKDEWCRRALDAEKRLTTERARSAALQAEVERMREALAVPCHQPDACDSACKCCQHRWHLSQSPTENT